LRGPNGEFHKKNKKNKNEFKKQTSYGAWKIKKAILHIENLVLTAA